MGVVGEIRGGGNAPWVTVMMMNDYHDDHDVMGYNLYVMRDPTEKGEKANGILLMWWVGIECVPDVSPCVHSILIRREAFTGCLHIWGFDTRADWDWEKRREFSYKIRFNGGESKELPV